MVRELTILGNPYFGAPVIRKLLSKKNVEGSSTKFSGLATQGAPPFGWFFFLKPKATNMYALGIKHLRPPNKIRKLRFSGNRGFPRPLQRDRLSTPATPVGRTNTCHQRPRELRPETDPPQADVCFLVLGKASDGHASKSRTAGEHPNPH